MLAVLSRRAFSTHTPVQDEMKSCNIENVSQIMDSDPILEEIRGMIERSGVSQRQVEKKAGFSRGHLSRLLARKLEVKVWHVLAVLEALEAHPGEFFAKIYPVPRQAAVPQADPLRPDQPSGPDQPAAAIDEVLQRLYSLKIDSLATLRRRLARCEQAVAELESTGRVSRQDQDPDDRESSR